MEYSAKGIVLGKTELLKDFYPLLYALCSMLYALCPLQLYRI